MVAYGEFRSPYDKDPTDSRFVFYGSRYLIENYISHQWTEEDLQRADDFFSTHNVAKTPYPYPKELFKKIIKENHGYFPVKLEMLPEGTVANCHVPLYQISARKPYAALVTFLETILTHIWYPSTVATLSRRSKEIIEQAFIKSVEESSYWLVAYRLHDFGFRGCTCVEQSILGGTAHLLNFEGTDTLSAAFYAQYHLNGGKPVAESAPATEHSVMTSWPNESQAIRRMIDKFGGEGKVFSIVMDSYDYANALSKILPAVWSQKLEKGGTLVIRPDSGDPSEAVLMGLKAAESIAGVTLNSKGFKVLNGVFVLQGDGINYQNIRQIYDTALTAGFAASNVIFGMGGGLLQKVNRDTMSFATKLSYLRTMDGTRRDIMKKPKSDPSKISLPGILKVKRVNGIPTIFPSFEDEKDPENLFQVVWDCGPVPGFKWESFERIRVNVKEGWATVPKLYDPVSPELKLKISEWVKNFDANYEKIITAQ
jgi:nicotinic acid phosphoribosyltransferase